MRKKSISILVMVMLLFGMATSALGQGGMQVGAATIASSTTSEQVASDSSSVSADSSSVPADSSSVPADSSSVPADSSSVPADSSSSSTDKSLLNEDTDALAGGKGAQQTMEEAFAQAQVSGNIGSDVRGAVKKTPFKVNSTTVGSDAKYAGSFPTTSMKNIVVFIRFADQSEYLSAASSTQVDKVITV